MEQPYCKTCNGPCQHPPTLPSREDLEDLKRQQIEFEKSVRRSGDEPLSREESPVWRRIDEWERILNANGPS